jgi:RNA polymerase sigma factor (sigma-70 family)
MDVLGTYLNEIGRFPLLTYDEEVALAARINGPDAADAVIARNWLVSCNLRLVVKNLPKERPANVSVMDLIQEGNKVLLRAAEKYHGRNRFSTYATHWIRRGVNSGRLNQSLIHIPEETILLLVRGGATGAAAQRAAVAQRCIGITSSRRQLRNHPEPEQDIDRINRLNAVNEVLSHLSQSTCPVTRRRVDIVRRVYGLTGSGVRQTVKEAARQYKVCRATADNEIKRFMPLLAKKLTPYL